jgi:FAD/FMN-containing dehydrogenase
VDNVSGIVPEDGSLVDPELANRTDFISELSGALGEPALVTEDFEIAPYCVDWRREFGAPAICVARPRNVADVAAVVRLAASRGVAIVPQGGNTSLAGGAVPLGQRPQIILSLSRMNKIRSLDCLGMTMEVEAGCILQTAQEAAAEGGLLLPVSYAAEGSAQLGGAVSTNAGGINVLRYGMMRQRVLGLEAVLADGTIVDGMRRLVKDNAGYDWKQLFIGSEGTLGVVTAATIKLAPRPKYTTTAWLSVASPAAAMAVFALVTRELGDTINAFVLMSDTSLQLVERHFALAAPVGPAPWSILIEGGSSLAGLQDAMEEALMRTLESWMRSTV